MPKKIQVKPKHEEYFLFGIMITLFLILIIMSGVVFYPIIKNKLKVNDPKITGNTVGAQITKTPQEYYKMFQCSCCGQPIDAGCCGMAKQRKDYLDGLLSDGLEENEIFYQMVKKFGFDVLMDQSKEQEVRDYIKSQASENPPEIKIENPKYNFGTISQSGGVVSTTFLIKNSGGSDLIIDNMDSSCMCTTANLIYKGEEGPIFGMSMHGDNPTDYKLAISPGETAQLRVYYDPNAHGKQKKPEAKITREVTIISNDPLNFQKKVRIELIQVP